VAALVAAVLLPDNVLLLYLLLARNAQALVDLPDCDEPVAHVAPILSASSGVAPLRRIVRRS